LTEEQMDLDEDLDEGGVKREPEDIDESEEESNGGRGGRVKEEGDLLKFNETLHVDDPSRSRKKRKEMYKKRVDVRILVFNVFSI